MFHSFNHIAPLAYFVLIVVHTTFIDIDTRQLVFKFRIFLLPRVVLSLTRTTDFRDIRNALQSSNRDEQAKTERTTGSSIRCTFETITTWTIIVRHYFVVNDCYIDLNSKNDSINEDFLLDRHY